MMRNENEHDSPIGFSVLERFEECFYYVENSCLISDEPDSAMRSINGSHWNPCECQVVAVSMPEILADFGKSGGSYAMEPQAFVRFVEKAERYGIEFESRVYEYFEPLMLVEVARQSIIPD